MGVGRMKDEVHVQKRSERPGEYPVPEAKENCKKTGQN